jgi:ribosomal protein L3
VFSPYEGVDLIGITSGHGTTGTVKRFGVRKLQRKSHRGRRKGFFFHLIIYIINNYQTNK